MKLYQLLSFKHLQNFSSTYSTFRLAGGSDSKESACSAEDPGSISGSEDSPEKSMATYSSVLAWRIPSTEELGRLMGSQRVGHN